MNNNNEAIQTQQAWLKILMQECENEGAMHIYTKSQMLSQLARNIVWYISEKLNCCTNGIPGQAVRIAEWFIGSSIIYLPSQEACGCQLMLLLVTSSILIAAETNSARLTVTAQNAHSLLAFEGFFYRIEDFYSMRYSIMSTIGLHVSPTTCVQIGVLLAHEMDVDSYVVPVVAKVLDLAVKYLYDIEIAMLFTDFMRSQNGFRMRVRTLHLAAAGVLAAIKHTSPREDAARKLADKLNLPVGYIECIRDAILAELTKQRVVDLKPLDVLQHHRRFNYGNTN